METLQELNEALSAAGVDESVIGGIPGLIDARVKEGVESETQSLKLTADRAVGESKRLKDRLGKFVDADGNPIKVESLPELLAFAEKGRTGQSEEDYEELKARHQKAPIEERDAARVERDEYRSELERVLLDDQMKSDLADHGAEATRIKVAVNHLKAERDFKVEKLDGRWQAFEEVNGKAVPLSESIKDFMSTTEGKFFMPASGSSGGGAEGGDAPSKGSDTKEKRFLRVIKGGTPTEQSAARKEDQELYDKLKADAKKSA